ncbi:unnamed protein product [Urochloa decumbens]|uniref:Protein kinase domain-containing protein n=1 Tax=Urochloa decumbens TaxID=240449 RepID=A0ABC9AP30_9POAL
MISDLIHRRDKTKYKLGSNCNIKIFTEDVVKRITRNYSTLIGKGPSGEVYRGILDYDQVAVKRYIHRSSREEFMEVISICSQMSHKNLVKLIGYCIEDSTLIIITEFISRGNLDDILHSGAISIPLDVRLGIAIGCAEALSYIHSMKLSSSDSFLCHSAIKPTNLLLDDNLTAKVSDIEMSRLLLGGITQYSAFVRGSTEEGYLSTESDVYSFGAVLLELIARKRVKRGDINLIVTFRKVELNDITQNFSDLLYGGTSAKVYKGTLEDNTVVAVKKFFEVLEDFKEAFINGGIILSQLVHKNLVKLVGCSLDADTTPIFVYEYAAKGSLSDVLDGQEDFPLHLRVKIAIQTAEALEYLHSSSTGDVIRHGYVVPSKILLDNNFAPKLTGFSGAKRLVKDTKINSGCNAISSCLPTDELYTDAILDQCAQLKVKTDVYQFGVLLLVLISRKNFMSYADHHHLIFECIAAYEAENSGRTFFYVDIGADEEIFALEEIGRLALKCASMEVDERPTMKEVAEHLRIIGRSWKPTLVSETEVMAADSSIAEGAQPDMRLDSEIVIDSP